MLNLSVISWHGEIPIGYRIYLISDISYVALPKLWNSDWIPNLPYFGYILRSFTETVEFRLNSEFTLLRIYLTQLFRNCGIPIGFRIYLISDISSVAFPKLWNSDWIPYLSYFGYILRSFSETLEFRLDSVFILFRIHLT